MLLALSAALEAIFLVLGFPVLAARQCAVALDKLRELFVSHKAVLLGLEFDTRAMTVGIPDEYRQEVCSLLRRHYCALHHCKRMYVRFKIDRRQSRNEHYRSIEHTVLLMLRAYNAFHQNHMVFFKMCEFMPPSSSRERKPYGLFHI